MDEPLKVGDFVRMRVGWPGADVDDGFIIEVGPERVGVRCQVYGEGPWLETTSRLGHVTAIPREKVQWPSLLEERDRWMAARSAPPTPV